MKNFVFPNSYKQASHDFHHVFLKELELIRKYSKTEIDDSIRILIYGCGYNYPDVVLFSSKTKNTFGIDIQDVFYRDGFRELMKYHKTQGFSNLSSFLRTLYIRRRYSNYYKYLFGFIRKDIDFSSLKIQTVHDNHLPFPNEYFDITLSNAVMEHVVNVPESINELYRITKKGGYSIHLLHNYYSLFGAHMPEKICIERPWGHLRGSREQEGFLKISKTYLNKILPTTLKDEFINASFKIILYSPADINHNIKDIDVEFQFEGEEVLNSCTNLSKSDKEMLLSLYSKETILSRAFLYVCQK